MLKKREKIIFGIFIILFILLNMFNTYFITAQEINSYISPFNRTILSIISHSFGNFSFLLLVIILSLVMFRRDSNKMRFLILTTLVLNVFMLGLNYFSLYYSNAFAIKGFDIFKNPAEGISDGLFGEAMSELFLNFKIFIFIPFTVLIIVFLRYKKIVKKKRTVKIKKKRSFFRKKDNDEEIQEVVISNTKLTLKKFLTLLIISILSFATSVTIYTVNTSKNDFMKINSNNSTNGVEYLGVYPYYALEFLGIRYDHTTRKKLDLVDDEVLFQTYDYYNKNKTTYKNIIDNKMYSNILKVKDTNAIFHESLNLSNNDEVTGVFEGKNIKLIHLESLNYFLFEIPEVKERFVFLNKLIEESYFFENYYTSVGMGVSSDAEFSVLTGLYPSGDGTIYRDYVDYDTKLDTIPRLLSNKNYQSKVYHGDFELFYNRNKAYPDLIGFTDGYFSLEDYAIEFGFNSATEYMNSNKKGREFNGIEIKSPWPSEWEVHEFLEKDKLNFEGNYLMYSHFLNQHTPFLFNPYNNQQYEIDNYKKLNVLTRRYLEYIKYIDELIESIFFDPKTESSRIDDETVYIFYSDHGSSLKGGDMDILFGKEHSLLEERRLLQQTFAFIYAPSSTTNDKTLPEGLIKGRQSMIRGHEDLYRTIGDLFGLFDDSHYYFGVHGLSNEPSFVIDGRVNDLILNNKESNDEIFMSLRNFNTNNEINLLEYEKTLDDIILFKKLSDLLLKDKTVHEVIKKTLQK